MTYTTPTSSSVKQGYKLPLFIVSLDCEQVIMNTSVARSAPSRFVPCGACKVLCVHAVKARKESTSPLINIRTRWMWVVKLHVPSFQGNNPGTHWIGGWVGVKACLYIMKTCEACSSVIIIRAIESVHNIGFWVLPAELRRAVNSMAVSCEACLWAEGSNFHHHH